MNRQNSIITIASITALMIVGVSAYYISRPSESDFILDPGAIDSSEETHEGVQASVADREFEQTAQQVSQVISPSPAAQVASVSTTAATGPASNAALFALTAALFGSAGLVAVLGRS